MRLCMMWPGLLRINQRLSCMTLCRQRYNTGTLGKCRAYRHHGALSHKWMQIRCYSNQPNQNREDVYRAMFQRLARLEDATRFYGYSTIRVGLVITLVVGAGVYIFREYIRENVADEVSSVATKSLDDVNLQLKAHELAVALLYAVFSDPDIQSKTVKFVGDIFESPDTQEALIQLLSSVFKQPQTQENLIWLLKYAVQTSLDDEDFHTYLTHNVKELLSDENTKEGVVELIQNILTDPKVKDVAKDFVENVLGSAQVQREATVLAKHVVSGIVTDSGVRQQTGDALWSAVGYSVTPRWFLKAPDKVETAEGNPKNTEAGKTSQEGKSQSNNVDQIARKGMSQGRNDLTNVQQVQSTEKSSHSGFLGEKQASKSE